MVNAEGDRRSTDETTPALQTPVADEMKRGESPTADGAALIITNVVDRSGRNQTVEELVSPAPVKPCGGVPALHALKIKISHLPNDVSEMLAGSHAQ